MDRTEEVLRLDRMLAAPAEVLQVRARAARVVACSRETSPDVPASALCPQRTH